MALAVEAAARGPVTLIDMDFVNPYFRLQDHRDDLAALGVHILAPEARVAAIDSPALPPSTGIALHHPTGQAVVDLGGDPAGAIVIAQFAPTLSTYDLWAVVNFARPTTDTPRAAADLLREIVVATRLRLTGLISNTYVGETTTAEDILAGYAQTTALATLLGLPVVRLCAPPGLELPVALPPLLRVVPRIHPPW